MAGAEPRKVALGNSGGKPDSVGQAAALHRGLARNFGRSVHSRREGAIGGSAGLQAREKRLSGRWL